MTSILRKPRTVWVFLMCLLASVMVMSIGWRHPITDVHGFRQTQTAFTAYFMVGHAPKFAYETPLFGPPWSIPFELPVFQWIVAGIVSVINSPLDQTGRFVSIVFFLMTLLPAYHILKLLFVPVSTRYIILSLLVISPFYIFWSRTCMIESTALFLSMTYLALAMSYFRKPHFWIGLFTVITGVLAGCVKVTTFFPFFLALLIDLLATIHTFSPKAAGLSIARRLAWKITFFAVIPILAIHSWTCCADHHKAANPLSNQLTSSQLTAWNFGTLAQRESLATWQTILERSIQCFGIPYPLFFVFLFGLCLVGQRISECLACVVVYFVTPLVFTNLYFSHDYYQYANLIFLIAAVGFTFTGMLEAGGKMRQLVPLLFVVVMLSSIRYYCHDFLAKQLKQDNGIQMLCAHLVEITNPNDVIVVMGCDWSSEIPYYSRRRALMFPDWSSEETFIAQYDELLIRNYRVAAFVVKKQAVRITHSRLAGLLSAAGLSSTPTFVQDGFEVYH